METKPTQSETQELGPSSDSQPKPNLNPELGTGGEIGGPPEKNGD